MLLGRKPDGPLAAGEEEGAAGGPAGLGGKGGMRFGSVAAEPPAWSQPSVGSVAIGVAILSF